MYLHQFQGQKVRKCTYTPKAPAWAKAKPSQAWLLAFGPAHNFLKPRPPKARPKPGLSGQAGAGTSLYLWIAPGIHTFSDWGRHFNLCRLIIQYHFSNKLTTDWLAYIDIESKGDWAFFSICLENYPRSRRESSGLISNFESHWAVTKLGLCSGNTELLHSSLYSWRLYHNSRDQVKKLEKCLIVGRILIRTTPTRWLANQNAETWLRDDSPGISFPLSLETCPFQLLLREPGHGQIINNILRICTKMIRPIKWPAKSSVHPKSCYLPKR